MSGIPTGGGEPMTSRAPRDASRTPLRAPFTAVRRWLFFKVGHGAVMDGMTANLAGLASQS